MALSVSLTLSVTGIGVRGHGSTTAGYLSPSEHCCLCPPLVTDVLSAIAQERPECSLQVAALEALHRPLRPGVRDTPRQALRWGNIAATLVSGV